MDNFYRVHVRVKTAIASFNLCWPVITARTSLKQLGNWSLLRGRIFPWTTGALGGIEWSLWMRWMAGPPLEIYVQSAECHRGFMENTSEWSRLPHAHCPWSAKFSGSVPFSRTHSFSFLDVLTLAPMQLLAYELPFQSNWASTGMGEVFC